MWSQGRDQFHMILTSDGGSYKDDKTSDFKINLVNPINLGEETWEVGLVSLSYPRTWITIGDAVGVYMKYYVSPGHGEKIIRFPNWQCQSLKELEGYIREEIFLNENVVDVDDHPFHVKTDDLGRVKITVNAPYYDIGISDNLLRILGLLGHDRLDDIRMDGFDKRQFCRNIIDNMCTEKPFPYSNYEFLERIGVCRNLREFEDIMHEHLLPNYRLRFEPSYEKIDLDKNVKAIVEEIIRSERLEYGEEEYVPSRMLALLFFYVRTLFKRAPLPKVISSVQPGIIDPIQRIFIYLNILDDIVVNNTVSRVLKFVNTKGNPFAMVQEDFSNPIYLPVRKGLHNMLHVYIKNDQGENVPFQNGTVLMLLHFRRKEQ